MLNLPDGRVLFGDAGSREGWYNSPQAKDLLSSTYDGRLLFVWEAKYEAVSVPPNGTIDTVVRQFDEVAFNRVLTDDTYLPPEEARISVDSVDKSKVVQFTLYPTALTRKKAPWFSHPIVINARPDKGEVFFNFWVVDEQFNPRRKMYRTVVGVEKNGQKVLTVICPSGKIVITATEDLSYEGE